MEKNELKWNADDTHSGTTIYALDVDKDGNVTELKYFVPEITDIRVGYECEMPVMDYSCHDCAPKDWEKHIIGQGNDLDDIRGMSAYIVWSHKFMRVPFLTKEQIEAEGWKFKQRANNWTFIKGEIRINYSYEDKTIKIYDMSSTSIQYLFFGECKDINTFRYICKLLGI